LGNTLPSPHSAGLTRSEISKNVCYGNTPKTQLDKAFTELPKNNLAKVPSERNEKGQPTERWFAATAPNLATARSSE
jgi:hypothetical protein